MFLLLVVVFVVMPLVELYVLIQVGQEIGVLPTILLLIAVSVLGGWLVRREGAKAWRAFRTATEQGRIPGREVADGALVLFGGALLLAPGFVTDVLGLVLLLPPTRALVRRTLLGWATRRVRVVQVVSDARTLRDRRPTQRVRSTRLDEDAEDPPSLPPI